MGETDTHVPDSQQLAIPPGTTALYVGESSSADAVTTRLEQASDRLSTRTVRTAADAATAVDEGDVDCLISEYELPDADGVSLLDSVRMHHPDLPFILFTDNEAIETATAAISAGVTEYILRSSDDATQQLTNAVVSSVHRTAALHERDLLKRLINVVPVGVAIHDIDGTLIEANDRGRDLLGIANTEPLDAVLDGYQAFHPDGTPFDVDEYPPVRAFRTGAPVDDVLLVIHRPDGEEVWVSMSSIPMYDETGEDIVRVISTGEDITELKRRERQLEAANDELKEARNRFDALTDNASVAVLTIDDTSTVRYANETVEDVFGHSPDALAGEPLDVVIPDRLVDDHYDAVDAFLASGERTLDWSWVELPGRHANGDEIDIGVSFGTTQVNGDRLFTAVIRDITEQKARERELADKREQLETTVAELQRSNQELEQFAHAVSHDLKEPIRMVSSYLGLLDRRYRGSLDDDADEFIEYAVDGSERARRMVDDLLEYAQVDHEEADDDAVDLNGVVDTVARDCTRAVPDRDVEVSVGALPTAVGNRTMLEKVFQNLLTNAIEHSDRDDLSISITAEEGDRRCVVTVADNGPGIPAENRDRLFELFSAGPDSDGTGVGLALCEKIVHNHGGELWLDEADDGTAFSFLLRTAS